MCEGDIQTNPRPQEFYRAGTAAPGFEIPGSATDIFCVFCMLVISKIFKILWIEDTDFVCEI